MNRGEGITSFIYMGDPQCGRLCGGTGIFEKLEEERKAVEEGDPLRPSNTEGISLTVRGAGSWNMWLHGGSDSAISFAKRKSQNSIWCWR